MNKIPNKIYIQQYEDPEIEGFAIDDVTWCVDRVHDFDVPYILEKDHIAEVSKMAEELAELKAENIELTKAFNCVTALHKHSLKLLSELEAGE